MSKNKNLNRYLLLLSFVSGMSVMAMEITASRLLAPHFGTSLFVWTNIIGVVLIALSLGYYFGGNYADKHPHIKYLLYPLLLASILFFLIPWLVDPLASLINITSLNFESTTVIIFVSSLLATLLLLAFPIFLLGITSPFIIRLYEANKKELGHMAGMIFALSTLGSILGTFLPTLLIIPLVGSQKTIIIFTAILLFTVTLGLFPKKYKFLSLLFFILPFIVPTTQELKEGKFLVHQKESSYQFIQVYKTNSDIRYLVYNEGGGIQSEYHPENTMSNTYNDYYLPLLYQNDSEQKEIAIIGLAGGSISHLIHNFFDNFTIDGVEIDKEVVKIAKEYFDLNKETNPNLNIFIEDGKLFLKNNKKKYDLIVIDAYANQMYIPWTLTTEEFWQETQRSLSKDGMVSMNINAVSEDSKLLVAISNTLAKVYPEVTLTKADRGGDWNYILTGSMKPLNLEKLQEESGNMEIDDINAEFLANSKKVEFDKDLMVLTNDKAPVEYLTDKMILDHIMGNI